ncbi:hypothetical protein FSP39_013858 [Pinctada imbricata]|uniref:Very-long-chain (3R)-3-hydroxyacyl-CoA dehydratase n=1 Tax=Pinctada imbricata TaxID=66713 RepID=A0AA88XMC0_PINIB|nr:hypothetical protein FSP39_013858 [Pinctada imbricata]
MIWSSVQGSPFCFACKRYTCGNEYLHQLSFFSWSAILLAVLNHVFSNQTLSGVYEVIGPLLNIFQTAAVLEILHCAFGLVRSSVVLTAFQVFSRVFCTWAIAYSVTSVQGHYSVGIFVLAWAVTEVIRYAFYFFSLIGGVPYAIQWCRYTFFYVLYPFGVTGELLAVYQSLAEVKQKKLYHLELPNAANFSFNFYYFLIFFMLMYIPVFPQLYFHMIAQRKKVIGGAKKKMP